MSHHWTSHRSMRRRHPIHWSYHRSIHRNCRRSSRYLMIRRSIRYQMNRHHPIHWSFRHLSRYLIHRSFRHSNRYLMNHRSIRCRSFHRMSHY